MGGNYLVIVGVYLKCIPKVERKDIKKGKACTKCDYKGYTSFCPKCGVKTIQLYKEELVFVDPTEHFDDNRLRVVDLNYSNDNNHYFVSNMMDITNYSTGECDEIIEIPDKAQAIKVFEELFKHEIIMLRKHYISVNIEFGSISYYS